MPEKKKNSAEELVGMYRIVKEAGGSIVDWQGNRIKEKDIGMENKKNHNIIAAATLSLGKEISEKIIPEKYK